MKITRRTRVKDLLPLLTEKRMKYLLDNIQEYPLERPILSMTIGEFAEIIFDQEAYIKKILRPHRKAYVAFGQLKSFKRQMEEVSKIFEKMQVKHTAIEKQAMIGVNFIPFIGNLLLLAVRTFHLHSIKEAESIPLSDIIIVMQDNFSSLQYQRNYSRIMEDQYKSKNK